MVRSFLVLGPTNSEGGPVVDRGVLVCSVDTDFRNRVWSFRFGFDQRFVLGLGELGYRLGVGGSVFYSLCTTP